MKQKTNVTPLQKIGTSKEKDDRSVVSSLSPREIVSELDRYVIGQQAAKRAVAIALRNRWRRQALKGDNERWSVTKKYSYDRSYWCGKKQKYHEGFLN